jgi:hypothetical protein
MSCVYTGALVHFVEYGFTAPADLYDVGNATVIRWNQLGQQYVQSQEQEDAATHQAYFGCDDNNFHREDLGVTVLPSHSVVGERR